MVITSKDLQNAYINLYKELRRYVWVYPAVKALVDLEVSIFSRFPDISTIKHNLNTMYDFAKNIGKDDEDLMDAFYDVFTLLEDTNNDDVYADIFKVEEVLV